MSLHHRCLLNMALQSALKIGLPYPTYVVLTTKNEASSQEELSPTHPARLTCVKGKKNLPLALYYTNRMVSRFIGAAVSIPSFLWIPLANAMHLLLSPCMHSTLDGSGRIRLTNSTS